MTLIGGPLKDMDSSQIVMIAKAGSALYGLATPESDVDYIVIYAEPTEVSFIALRSFVFCISRLITEIIINSCKKMVN
jgi:hypothetical protein